MDSQGRNGVVLHAVVLLATVLLAGCGADTEPDGASRSSASPQPSESSEPSSAPVDAPECSDVWQEAATLPRSYRGCVEDGELVERDTVPCSSGQRMIRYADRYYGVLGGTIHEVEGPLEQDRDYRAAIRSCTA